MAQNNDNKDFVPTIPRPDTNVVLQTPTISQVPKVVTTQQYKAAPTIQNVIPDAQVYTAAPQQPQVIYTTPVYQPSQQQPNVQNSNSFTEQLANKFVNNLEELAKENKTAAQTNAQQPTSTTAESIESKIRSDAAVELTQTYNARKQAVQDQQTKIIELEKQLEEFKQKENEIHQEQLEENMKQSIAEEFQDRMDALQNEKDILIQQQEEFKQQQNAPEDLEKILQEQNDLQSNKVEQASAQCKKAETDLSKLIGELTSTENQINSQNESMGLFKKFLIAIGLSNEPEKLIKLREKVHEISEKIEKQKDKVEKNQNILTKEEEALLEMVGNNMEKINEFKKKSIEEKEKEINVQMEIQKAIKEDKELQDKEKTFLKNQAVFEMDRKGDYIEKLRLDDNNQKEIDKEIRKQNLYKHQQKAITLSNKVTSLKDVNKAKGKGPLANFY